MALVLSIVILGGCTAAKVTASKNNVASRGHVNAATGCPNPFPALPSGQMIDLCGWRRLSAYGDYALVMRDVRNYDSCAMWKADVQRWIDAGKPDNYQPGGTGHMQPAFAASIKTLETSPVKGTWHVQVSFFPVRGRSLIKLVRPEWPGMTSDESRKVDTIMALILEHEEGHQNLDGQLATAYMATFEVPGNQTASAAEQQVRALFSDAQGDALAAASQAVSMRYDALTQNGLSQSALGGTDPPGISCGQIGLISEGIRTQVGIRYSCSRAPFIYDVGKFVSESSVYQPQPPVFQAVNSSWTVGCDSTSQSNKPPGVVASSGEDRSVTTAVSGGGTVAGRTEHDMASGSASATYTYRSTAAGSSLLLSGEVACDLLWQDTNPPSNPSDQIRPLSRPEATYVFTINGTAQVSIKLTGHWPDFNNDLTDISFYKKLPPPSSGVYFDKSSLGSPNPYSETLQSGTYEFSIYAPCYLGIHYGGAVDNSSTGHVSYVVDVES